MCPLNLNPLKCFEGFTLAELLIALLIIAEIATFTIPKIISSQANNRNNAIAKEAAGMLATAFQQAQIAGNISSSTKIGDLTQYMNYVKTDTSTQIDDWQTSTYWGCSPSIPCLVLHSGAKLAYSSTMSFGGTASTDFIFIQVDPDGVYSGTTNGPGKAVYFAIQYNGRIRNTLNPDTDGLTPPWFSW